MSDMSTAQKLAADLEAGWACNTSPDEMTAAAAELRRLDAKVQALRKDAERYRWLRDEAWGCNNKRGPHLVEFKPGHTPSFFTELAEQAADAAIDAARGIGASSGGAA